MNVILRESIPKLGEPGDVVQVSEGFARNYLLPQKKALIATPENIKNIDQYKQGVLKRAAKTKTEAESLAQKLSQVSCVIRRKVGKNGKLFGSVTPQDIQLALLKEGFRIDKREVRLNTPVKTIGDFMVNVRLHTEVVASIKVTVSEET